MGRGRGAGGRGPGRGGGPYLAGPDGECVCPKCGHRQPHVSRETLLSRRVS